MEPRDFFRNSIGLAIFGLTNGDYTNAKVSFSADGIASPVNLDVSLIPGFPSSIQVESACKNLAVVDFRCLNVVKPTLEHLEQQLASAQGVIKVKVSLTRKDALRDPMEFDADSTSWKWPSYYIDGDTTTTENK